jgi:hypothetical protein
MAEPIIPDVDKTISLYSGDVPDASTQTINEFDNAAEALTNYFIAVPSEYNGLAEQLNAFRVGVEDWTEYKKDQVDTIQTDAAAAATAAHAAAKQSEDARAIAIVSSHFLGEWSDLSGPATVPTTVSHEGKYWVLLRPLGVIEGHPPTADSPYWGSVQTLTVLRQPILLSPANGADEQVTAPTLEATPYANIYDDDVRVRREFEVDLASGDWSSPVYTYSGDVDGHTIATPLDTLTSYKWRCRDIALSGEVSDWSATWAFSTADIYIEAPSITAPAELADDVGETPTLSASAFSVANGGTDTHLNTDWVLINNSTLDTVWESLSDAENKTSITLPAEILQEGTEYRVRVRYRGSVYGVSSWAQSLFTTRDEFITVTNVELLSPEDGKDPWNQLSFKGSQFAVTGSKARHIGTRIQVYEGAVLLVDTEKTGLFDPGEYSGTDQIGTLSAGSPAVIASDATETAWRVFDKDSTTYWQINANNGWVGYSYSLSRDPYLTSYKIGIRNNITAPSQAPRDFVLQGSLNGSFWFDIDERTGVTWSQGQTKTFTVSQVSGTGYPQYRLRVIDNNGHETLEIASLELLTHTEGNPMEVVFPTSVLGATVDNMDYKVRIGYKGENEDVYVWSEWSNVKTGSSRSISPFANQSGSVITDGGNTYSYVQFNSNSSLIFGQDTEIEYFMVGGGGGRESGDNGGGGAGGIKEGQMVVATGTYPIAVGLGGSGYSKGGDSSAFGLVAEGGGAGGSSDSSPAMDGGCGGGAHFNFCSETCVAFGGKGSQGGDGGDGIYAEREDDGSFLWGPGGGGGAGGDGGSLEIVVPIAGVYMGYGGVGGQGITRDITGSSVVYARGGTGYGPESGVVGGDTIGGGASGHDDQTNGKKGAVIVRVKLDG